MAQYRLQVNGRDATVESWDPAQPLLYVLRNALGLHGPKFGCGLGQCGTCTVLIDGKPARSCLTSVEQRLRDMDKMGVDVQAISCSPFQFMYSLDPELGRKSARAINENLAAIYMFLDHPLIGVGPDNYPVLYESYAEPIGLNVRFRERPAHFGVETIYDGARHFARTQQSSGCSSCVAIGLSLRRSRTLRLRRRSACWPTS